ncbi:MAG: FkbM family methyltransferase [Blautia sp.]|nr:FkbM family methyltransferase [Blautia sp.]MCM1200771.1 FkbM family methyltransferase [Bacteroides fragilis]
MDVWYHVLDKIIREEVDKHQSIAIYTLGMVGLCAKSILNNRYGREGIYIDNYMAQYNKDIITFKQFIEKMDTEKISIILCASDEKLNRELIKEVKKHSVKACVRSIWRCPNIISEPDKEAYFKEIKQLCLVDEVKGFSLIRIGKQNDGGYVLINDFSDTKFAYGFGIGADASFEKGLADRGIEVYCYDPVIEYFPESHAGLYWNRIGISGEDKADSNMLSMRSILRNNQHANEENMILKMDVEGAEWETINSMESGILNQFSQMIFEFHGLTNINRKNEIFSVLKKINETHQAVWIHANSVCSSSMGKETIMPSTLEVTYANKRRYRFEHIDYNAPLSIDTPNRIGILDLELKHWGRLDKL